MLLTQKASEVCRGNRIQLRQLKGEPLGMAQARIVSVPMVAVENRPAVPVMERRDYKARRF